jgi:hypothetical protein
MPPITAGYTARDGPRSREESEDSAFPLAAAGPLSSAGSVPTMEVAARGRFVTLAEHSERQQSAGSDDRGALREPRGVGTAGRKRTAAAGAARPPAGSGSALSAQLSPYRRTWRCSARCRTSGSPRGSTSAARRSGISASGTRSPRSGSDHPRSNGRRRCSRSWAGSATRRWPGAMGFRSRRSRRNGANSESPPPSSGAPSSPRPSSVRRCSFPAPRCGGGPASAGTPSADCAASWASRRARSPGSGSGRRRRVRRRAPQAAARAAGVPPGDQGEGGAEVERPDQRQVDGRPGEEARRGDHVDRDHGITDEQRPPTGAERARNRRRGRRRRPRGSAMSVSVRQERNFSRKSETACVGYTGRGDR